MSIRQFIQHTLLEMKVDDEIVERVYSLLARAEAVWLSIADGNVDAALELTKLLDQIKELEAKLGKKLWPTPNVRLASRNVMRGLRAPR